MNNNQNNKISYSVVGIVIGLILAGIFFPMMRYNGFGMMNRVNNPAYGERANGNMPVAGTIDKHFIEQMIPHHEGAIDMANLALEKAKRPEIKTLATAIIGAQSTEIGDMNNWYKEWFGNEVPLVNAGMMGGGMMSQSGMHMGGGEDMTALLNATDFDKAFIEQMIPHHQLAIMMANMLQSATDRPEMQQLAKNIIESQSKEIKEMQVWYQTWYK